MTEFDLTLYFYKLSSDEGPVYSQAGQEIVTPAAWLREFGLVFIHVN